MSPAPARYDRRAVWSWALYDFANSAFTTLVVTFVYATYFTQAIAADEISGTALWTRGVTITAVAVAVLSPFLGAMADRGGLRKRYLLVATAICVGATTMTFFAEPGEVVQALVWVVIANIAYEIGLVFYNAFLPDLAPPDRIGRISGAAWGLGYAGGLVALAVGLFGFVLPEVAPFGLDKATGEHIRATNLLVAAWFAVFAIPAFLFIREIRPEKRQTSLSLFTSTAREIGGTFRSLGQYRQIVRLLVARLFYNDGLVTIFSLGGIYAAGTFGFTTEEIIYFGMALNLAAGLGAFLFGFVDDKVGGKKTIYVSLVLLCVATLVAVFGQTKAMIWAAGLLVGLAAGPNQSASRSLLGRFVPDDKETEFYGFFAFSGKLTAFMGPLLFGILTTAFATQRAGVAVVLVFFFLGALVLTSVDEREGIALAGRPPGRTGP
ncbi:MAG: MFS transporter [Rhodothermales bacterium]